MDCLELSKPLSESIDWTSLRFPGETVLRHHVDQNEKLVQEAIRWCNVEECPGELPSGLRWAGMRAALLSPALANLSSMLKDHLRLDALPEFTVFPCVDWFAEVLPAEPGAPLRLAISSGATKSLGAREALFYFGRRMARRIFGQYAFLMNPTIGKHSPDRETLLLRGLWKFQELTCDRIGLLCCQSEDIASRVIVRSATGLDADMITDDWSALLSDRVHEEDAMVSDSVHDFTLLRIAAIRQFAQTEKYLGCLDESQDVLASLPSPSVIEIGSPVTPNRPEVPPIATTDSRAFAPSIPASDQEDHPETRHDHRSHAMTMQNPTFSNGTKEPIPQRALESASATMENSTMDSEDSRHESDIRGFALWGSLWVVGARESIDDDIRANLWEMFGSEATAALDELAVPNSDECCARHCVRYAASAAAAPLETRVGIIEDLVHLAMADARISERERERILDLAELLELSPQQVADIAAEFIDPDFSKYRFSIGQSVEVKLDDEWLPGQVQTVEPSGDVRVHFVNLNQTFWLNPTADLIRPAHTKTPVPVAIEASIAAS